MMETISGDYPHGLVNGHSNGQLPRRFAGLQLGFQRLNLSVFGCRCFLQRISDIGLDQSNRALLFPLGQLQPLVQLLFKITITHLLEDVGVPRFADLEGFVAVGVDDFVHGRGSTFRWLFPKRSSGQMISLGKSGKSSPALFHKADSCGGSQRATKKSANHVGFVSHL